MGKALVLEAPHPEKGRVYAAVDPAARYVSPRVCEFRFSALLSPYTSEEEARAALAEAGADMSKGGAK